MKDMDMDWIWINKKELPTIRTIWIWIGYGSRRLDGCQWYWVYGLDKKQQDDMDANDREDLNQQDNMDANDTEDMDMNWIWNNVMDASETHKVDPGH